MPKPEVCGCDEALALRAEVERLRGLLEPAYREIDLWCKGAGEWYDKGDFPGTRARNALGEALDPSARAALAKRPDAEGRGE